ncbi:hypothetical protein LTR62_001285 [Meristemomyces frigidus]|uniref:ABM domain-containing protein n=1 Tax=Meristemomyces frigidus TaxID=1508187 RepID=A0AAN7T8L1_9PEZI|nr:hypothetical protein LTR62_001285 [Meristemomyces frigidus]
MPTTEIALFPLKAGATPGDPDNHAAPVANDTFDTLKTIDGMQQINFGTRMEDPSQLQLMVTWDKLSSHLDFTKTEAYKPFLSKFLSIVAGEPKMMHADFQPPGALAKTFAAPTTEFATFYFEGEPPADYVEKAMECVEVIRKEAGAGFLDAAVGVTHEVVEHEGVKGKAAVLAVGWRSREAHMEFRETKAFKENIHLLRRESKKLTMWHVQFMEYQG